MLLSKKKSLVLSEYYYERSTALSLCVCLCACRFGAVARLSTLTQRKPSLLLKAQKKMFCLGSLSQPFFLIICYPKQSPLFFGKRRSLLFSSLLCVPRGGGGVVVAVVVRSLTEEKEDDIYQRRR